MPSYHHDVDIDPLDFSEAPRLAKEAYPRGAVAGGIACAVLFLAMLVYGSLPELSPSEIVAMDGYAGERPTRHIFNLQSLEDSEESPALVKQNVPSIARVPPIETAKVEAEKAEIDEAVTEIKPVPVETAQVAVKPTTVAAADTETVSAAVAAPSNVEIANVEIADVESTSEAIESSEPKVQLAKSEVALRVFAENAEQKVVAAQATTPAVRELPTTIVTSALVAEPSPMPMPIKRNEYKHAELARGPALASVATTDEKGRLLPLRAVLNDFTEVKKSPSSQSSTVLSLGRGVVVTAFEKQGDWVHIGTNDGSSITGYVLESSIGKINR